jgi:excisionase family DNA binding protein
MDLGTMSAGTENPSRLLEPQEVADYLGMNVRWVYDQARAGRLPHVRLGRYVRFRRESIDAWLEARESQATMPAGTNRPADGLAPRGTYRRARSHAGKAA